MTSKELTNEAAELEKRLSKFVSKLEELPRMNKKILGMASTGLDQNFNLIKVAIINADVDKGIA